MIYQAMISAAMGPRPLAYSQDALPPGKVRQNSGEREEADSRGAHQHSVLLLLH
jgi:hypothetical protein